MTRKRLRLRTLKSYLLIAWAAWLCVVISPSSATIPFSDSVTPLSVTQDSVTQGSVAQAATGTESLQQAKALYDAGRFTEAVAVLQQAIQAYQQQGNTLDQALALSNLALTYHQLGDWTEANQAIHNSLNLLDQATDSADRRLAQAQALDIQAQLQLAQGQAEAALTAWQQAAQHYKQLDDRDRLVRNQIKQSRALQTLGFYQRAITLLSELEQTLQSQPDSLTKAAELRSLGEALRVVGNLEQSEQRLQESLAIAQRIAVNQAMNQGDTASVNEAVALTQLSLGNTARAQSDHTAALNWYEQASSANVTTTALQANVNRFSLLIETAQSSVAQALLPQIQTQLAELPPSRATVYARINLAQSLTKAPFSSSDPATLLSTAAQQGQQLGDRRTQAYALGLLGSLYEKTQQWPFAADLTRQALQLALSSNATDVTYLWQWQLGRILKAQADQGIDPAQNRAEAIATYEEALKTLQSLRLDLASINPDQQFSFRESVEPAYRELIDLLLQPANAASQEKLAKARKTLESLQTVELQNFFREACLDVPIAIDRIVEQTSTLSAQTAPAPTAAHSTSTQAAVIYPIILPNSLEIVLKLPNQNDLRHYSITVNQTEVEATLLDLRQQITQPETRRSLQALSQQVYDWLIRPMAAELSNNQISTLVFVLDGFLKNIPMAALYDGERYLIETYDIALTPGLELLDPQPLERQQIRLLFAGLSSPIEDFSPLTAVEQERDGILSEVPGTVVLLNQEFTAEALQTEIEQAPFQIVHLATHGEFSSDRNKTFIRALDRRINVDELNRILQTREVQPNPIELLTLSACQTAAGDERAALGLAGVAVRAGARSTLASLWSIDDQSSAFLMIEFYRQLVDNPALSKSQALRQAQLALVNHPNYNHPSYWAPYVLLGNWL
jgi:CHAT domain-containing protein/tetratricopeptide (TPR) repeat protein